MSTEPLPPWPERRHYLQSSGGAINDAAFYRDMMDYERARAEAAIARLKVAVEALDTISQSQNEFFMSRYAREALTAIGAIPE